jgi:hypothetical protein
LVAKVAERSATMRANSGSASATSARRYRSRADERCPGESKPHGLSKCVAASPSSSAFVFSFATNRSWLPAACSARATHASFA